MTILLFIAVLILLVMVHEAGHFIAAKICKMRVEEFAFGFPPKLFGIKRGETAYNFNLIPIGGFVKITGESFDEEERHMLKNDNKAFQNKPRIMQLFVLSAGVIMNLVLALALFTFANTGERMISSQDANYSKYINSPKVYAQYIVPDSPAMTSGIKPGDEIISFRSGSDKADLKSASSVVDVVKRNSDRDITVVYKNHLGKYSTSTVRAVFGLTEGYKTIGLGVVHGEVVKLSISDAFVKSLSDTYNYTIMTFIGIKDIFVHAFKGDNVIDQLSGPFGIAKIISSEASSGINNLLVIVAILSINLAVFNILPIPALDGGRIIFVIVEAIIRRPVNIKLQYYANAVGFLALIALMIVVTYFDLMK